MEKFHVEIKGSNDLPICLDLKSKSDNKLKPLVIFCHGFKGFKDWGAWELVSDKFAANDFLFLKFNFSHNGTTPDALEDFENLKAFSTNNYTKELEDLQFVIDWAKSSQFPLEKNWNKEIFLIGHSRGGGIALVKNFEEDLVVKTATWAGIDSFDRFGTKSQIAQWEKDGEHIFTNGRTGQKMPIKYQFYQDYINNKERLNIQHAVENTSKPLLVIHGTDDPAVLLESGRNINSWAQNAEFVEIPEANHVFGSKHPFTEKTLPKGLQLVVEKTIDFFKF